MPHVGVMLKKNILKYVIWLFQMKDGQVEAGVMKLYFWKRESNHDLLVLTGREGRVLDATGDLLFMGNIITLHQQTEMCLELDHEGMSWDANGNEGKHQSQSKRKYDHHKELYPQMMMMTTMMLKNESHTRNST
eukprot:11636611-Ditylum_brightwellii.AAC.1